MTPKKIMVIVGTRPEAIKMAPVCLALSKSPYFDCHLLATAQHRELLDQVFDVFELSPDTDLDLMKPNQDLSELSARLLTSVRQTLINVKPDAVLVHGDTATCLFSALAAFYERIPIGHVEAGLRTYDFDAPWPEEMNRRLTDPISSWCFAPTDGAASNLKAERIPCSKVFVTGNTVVDAILQVRDKVRLSPPQIPELDIEALKGRRTILVTGHRRESFGGPFEELCYALRDIVIAHDDVHIVYPVHLNPNVQEPVHRILGKENRVHLIPPVEYLPFVHLMDLSYFIISDSGGIQEEAPSLGKPVLVTRTVTERPEALEAGLTKLVGTDRRLIVGEATRLLQDVKVYKAMSEGDSPYGDGLAAERIIKTLHSELILTSDN